MRTVSLNYGGVCVISPRFVQIVAVEPLREIPTVESTLKQYVFGIGALFVVWIVVSFMFATELNRQVKVFITYWATLCNTRAYRNTF